jgi:TIR domain
MHLIGDSLTLSIMKAFLCHASEDKALVEQVYLRLKQTYPEIDPWLDKYEIIGGDDLIETIHAAISDADKFLVFLSPNSVDKPWVRTELRKALADEINGVKPEFIVPIKVGSIPTFPPFLESRFYIDIEAKLESEWLEDIYRSIKREKRTPDSPTENLAVSVQVASDNEKVAMLVFDARFWAEPISFKVRTSEKVVNAVWQVPCLKGMLQLSVSEKREDHEYAIAVQNHSIRPKHPFIIGLEFNAAGDPRPKIVGMDKWDGVGGDCSVRFISFQ